MKSKLKQLIAQREMQTGQRIPHQDLAAATGLDDNTISRWTSPKPFKRIETDTALKLCRYFDCGLDDLIYIDRG